MVPTGFALGGWLVQRHVAAGALLVALTQAIGLVIGAPQVNGAGLLPAVYCLYLAGRELPPARGVGILAAYSAVIAATGLGVMRALVGMLLFTGAWLVGQLVAEGTALVRAREGLAESLEQRDHDVEAGRVVDLERSRILSASLDTVERAVVAMRADTRAAAVSFDPDLLDRVGSRGESAIVDLRRILGILRTPSRADAPSIGGPLPSEDHGHRGVWRTDALLAVVLAAVGLGEATSASLGLVAISLSAVGPLGLACWRSAPAVAGILCALAPTVAMVTRTELPHGLAEMATVAMLAWAATTLAMDPGRHMRGMMLAIPAAAVIVLAALGLRHPTLSLIPVTVAAVAVAANWFRSTVHDAQGEVERRIASARTQLQLSAEAAVRAERRRIARELHDITSHAVAAMVLQTRAARALATRDPAAAHRALANALSAADLAMKELDELTGVLHDSDVSAGPEDLRALVDRLSATGLRIDLEGHAPTDPELAITVYRIVQEALSNSARHSPGARVRVEVTEGPDQVTVHVMDSGGRHGPGLASGTGFGLAGLAERVRLHGGKFDAGPTRPGFRVSAELPKRSRHETFLSVPEPQTVSRP